MKDYGFEVFQHYSKILVHHTHPSIVVVHAWQVNHVQLNVNPSAPVVCCVTKAKVIKTTFVLPQQRTRNVNVNFEFAIQFSLT